jgi:4-amino-4-deoxy-L-arabinose transferase-like glycosyltransferase
VSDLDRRPARVLLAALVVVPLLLRAAFAASVELAPDEAYYAAWSRAPAASYLDHPPLSAWLIAASTALFGETELAVRLPALLCGALLTSLLYAAARALGASRRSALLATAAGSLTLFSSAGATLMTPDAPLALAWGAATTLVLRAAAGGWGALGGASAAIALGFASKLTAGLLWAFGATAPIPARRRAALLAAALLGLAPFLAWNAAHGWPTLVFHGLRATERARLGLDTFAELLAAQVGLLCLLPAVLVGAAWVSGLRRGSAPGLRFAALSSAGPVACVLLLSLATKVEANWIAPAYFGAFAASAVWLDGSARRRRFAGIAAAFAALVTLVAHLHALRPFLPLPEGRNPAAQLRGWRDLAAAVRAERGALPVLASRYQEAAELAFYLPDAGVTTLPRGARVSQYSLWASPAREAPLALCVWRPGEAPPRGRRVEVAGRIYHLARCAPGRWKEP